MPRSGTTTRTTKYITNGEDGKMNDTDEGYGRNYDESMEGQYPSQVDMTLHERDAAAKLAGWRSTNIQYIDLPPDTKQDTYYKHRN